MTTNIANNNNQKTIVEADFQSGMKPIINLSSVVELYADNGDLTEGVPVSEQYHFEAKYSNRLCRTF